MKQYTPDQLAVNGILIAQTSNSFNLNENDLNPKPIGDEINEWSIVGCLKSNDFLLSSVVQPSSEEVFYGYLLQSKNDSNSYTLTVRGTGDSSEWLDDCKFLPEYNEGIGFVESGFYDIYKKMQITVSNSNVGSVAEVLSSMLNSNPEMNLTITGHSLGSAVATYIMYDVCKNVVNKENVDMCLFASPKPGNAEFAKNFDLVTQNYAVYNYSKDIVPDTPPSVLGYSSLNQVTTITPDNSQAVIKNNLLANHHVVSYCAMLDYNYTKNWSEYLVQNGDTPDCIVSANPTANPVFINDKNTVLSMILKNRESAISPVVSTTLKNN